MMPWLARNLAAKAPVTFRAGAWKHPALSSVLIVSACIGGYYLGGFAAAGLTQRSVQPKLESVNGLAIDPQSLDLGEVWETPNHPLTLQIQNLSGEIRSIVDFSGSCGCLKVEPHQLTILPGQTAELSLTLDLTRRLSYQVGLAQRLVSVKFNPVFQGDFASTPGWELKALVHSRVTLDSVQLAFTDQCAHAGTRVTRKIRAKAHVSLERLEASAVPPLAAVRVESVPESPDSFVILVSPNPQLPVGPFTFEVHVKAITSDGEVHRCASIEATGEMQPSTRIFPRLILLGEHSVSEQAEADMSVRLPANGWTIDHFETDSPDTAVARTGVEPDGSIKLRVTQQITKIDDHMAQVRIIVRNPNKETEVLSTEVRYHGIRRPRQSKTSAVVPKQP